MTYRSFDRLLFSTDDSRSIDPDTGNVVARRIGRVTDQGKRLSDNTAVRNFPRRRALFEVHRIICNDVLPPTGSSYSTWWLATRRDGAKLRAVSFAFAIALTL